MTAKKQFCLSSAPILDGVLTLSVCRTMSFCGVSSLIFSVCGLWCLLAFSGGSFLWDVHGTECLLYCLLAGCFFYFCLCARRTVFSIAYSRVWVSLGSVFCIFVCSWVGVSFRGESSIFACSRDKVVFCICLFASRSVSSIFCTRVEVSSVVVSGQDGLVFSIWLFAGRNVFSISLGGTNCLLLFPRLTSCFI